MNTTPTLEEYLRSKMSRWDYVCWYSFVPFILCFVLLAIQIQFDSTEEGKAFTAFLFIMSFIFFIILRGFVLAPKIELRKEDYNRLYPGNTGEINSEGSKLS